MIKLEIRSSFSPDCIFSGRWDWNLSRLTCHNSATSLTSSKFTGDLFLSKKKKCICHFKASSARSSECWQMFRSHRLRGETRLCCLFTEDIYYKWLTFLQHVCWKHDQSKSLLRGLVSTFHVHTCNYYVFSFSRKERHSWWKIAQLAEDLSGA